MQATLSSKFQITIPSKLRKKFALRPGMKLDFDELAPDLRATPRYNFPVKKMYGVIGSAGKFAPGKSARAALASLRGYDRDRL